jgi:hypothetical protein
VKYVQTPYNFGFSRLTFNQVLKTFHKSLLFLSALPLFQLVFSGFSALINPILKLGKLNLEDWGDRTFTHFFMSFWIALGFYWIVYLFFIFSPKQNKNYKQVIYHLLIAASFSVIFSQNAGGFWELYIPLSIATFLNYFFLKRVFD